VRSRQTSKNRHTQFAGAQDQNAGLSDGLVWSHGVSRKASRRDDHQDLWSRADNPGWDIQSMREGNGGLETSFDAAGRPIAMLPHQPFEFALADQIAMKAV
jgi:hypothetical protein